MTSSKSETARTAELDVLILRDPRESLKKCSLTPVRGLPGIEVREWRIDRRFEVGRRLLLHPDGAELVPGDRELGLGLMLIDCAWRRVPQLLGAVDGELVTRRLPPLATAYPRVSKVFQDPGAGLASIEALYAACAILGDVRGELLAAYRWRDAFLDANPDLPRG
ncbi:MAG: DUF367 domain-containing protein [Planctomycetota bacterium]